VAEIDGGNKMVQIFVFGSLDLGFRSFSFKEGREEWEMGGILVASHTEKLEMEASSSQ
jgi:hypothetical protein